MASVGALVGVSGSRWTNYKPNKNEIFGDFRAEILLSNPTAELIPNQIIEGEIEIYTTRVIEHYGFRVQLEACIFIKYDTKIDNRITNHHKRLENLLAGSIEAKNRHYFHSPVGFQIIGSAEDYGDKNLDYDTEPFLIARGTHKYPFYIFFNDENLPAPFTNQYGSLTYKIVGYFRGLHFYVSIAEKSLKFRGNRNISKLPEIIHPFRHETGIHKSWFSSKKAITCVFEVTNREIGYLPGEIIHFKIKITNPKSHLVKRFSVRLMRRTTYQIEGATNSKSFVLNANEFECLEASKESEIEWTGGIRIPRNSIPSYEEKSIYHVAYQLEYQVKVEEYSTFMKGKVIVSIGTSRDGASENARASNNDDGSDVMWRPRSSSIVSVFSNSSLATLPPNYSNLSSRSTSVASFATLPPHYDDLT